MRAAAQPYGAKLRLPTRIKIKGLNAVPRQGSSWGGLWNAFEWNAWIRPQIDLTKTRGGNLVKVTGSGATAAYPAQSVFLARVQQFIAYCREQGLLVYWNFCSDDSGGSATAATPFIQSLARTLEAFPNVIGMDCANEIDVFGVGADQAIGHLVAARQVTSLPLTASIAGSSPAPFTGANAVKIAPYCDFMDFHPYFAGTQPTSADFDAYRASAIYKPWLIGECGEVVTSQNAPARWNALGAISSSATDCLGVVGFCTVDYDNALPYGMYAPDLTTLRTNISGPFDAWPSRI